MKRSLAATGLGAIAVAVLLVAELSSRPADPERGTTLILLEDSRFVPSRIEARAGVPLAVVLRNVGSERHELGFSSLHVPDLADVEWTVDPGKSRVIWISFREPGTHPLVCSLPGHAAAGMAGVAFVAR